MIRFLQPDGYFPKRPTATGLIEFQEFVVVAPKKVFWTLQVQQERRELFDDGKLIGRASDEQVDIGSLQMEAVLRNASGSRGEYFFGAYSLFLPGEEIPFFLTTYDPRSGWDAKRLHKPTFLTSVPRSEIRCKDNCVFVHCSEGTLIAQFLSRKKHPVEAVGGRGTIHVRADLEEKVQFELTAALFGMSILF